MKATDVFRKIHTARRLSFQERVYTIRVQARELFAVSMVGRILSERAARAFHIAYYHDPTTWKQNQWFGFPIQQFPSDLYIYQEVIALAAPDFIIQTGIYDGGSALFLAHMLDLCNAPASAVVIVIDIHLRERARALSHPRLRLIEGSSTAPETLEKIDAIVAPIPLRNGGLVSLDSDHGQAHVTRELELYPRFVGRGNFLIIEDTNVNGHPVLASHGPGPREAMDEFIKHATNFHESDVASRQMLSSHSWLKRNA